MLTARHIRTRRTPTHTFALYDYGAQFIISAWDLRTDERFYVEVIPYFGIDDRIAARHMAQGCLDSLDPEDLPEPVDLDKY